MTQATFDYSGRTVIVTGGAQGIGLALCARFAADGATTYLVDIDEGLAAEAAGTLAGDVRHAAADVGRTEAVEALVARAVEETGRVDVLVNNAGVLRDKVLWKLTDEDWETVLRVHLDGSFRCTRAVIPQMRAQSYGRIVNVTSYTGLHGNVGQGAYAAAKSGIIGLTRTGAKELARFGITVNAISPAARTRMIASIPEERLAEMAAEIPMNRFAEPEEIAAAVSFLGSDDAGYITGVVLPIDGGHSI
jgi:3-oxoacyl-[acyl-carrier protein] reductase